MTTVREQYPMTDSILYTQTTQCAHYPFIVGGLVSKVSLNREAITWSVHLYMGWFGRGAVYLCMILVLDLTSNYITRQPNNSIIHEFDLHLHLHLFSDSL